LSSPSGYISISSEINFQPVAFFFRKFSKKKVLIKGTGKRQIMK